MQASLKLLCDMICIAARTAPKAKGVDNLVTKILSTSEIEFLADEMDKFAVEFDHKGFARDAVCIRKANAVILFGTKMTRIGLKVCGNCGYENCEKAEKANAMCVYSSGDLGIAIGSAVSKAADFRLDNRIMYTVGLTAKKIGLMDKEVKIIYALPISVTGKNPFFDR